MEVIIVWLVTLLVALYAVARLRVGLPLATALAAVWLLLLTLADYVDGIAAVPLWLLLGAVAALNVPEWRRKWVSEPMLRRVRAVLPAMSETERTAIEAGSVWWEAELFRGDPEWSRLLDTPAAQLDEREQAFLDGPVEELCGMLDDWQINHQLNDLPEPVWDYLKRQRFFALEVPEQYGGHGFSAFAHSQVVTKVTSRSLTAGITVMVPNSLGPAELLLNYGTEAQKDHYLPRLARGEEIPCFALTGPSAGSDAGSIPDTGIVCYAEHEGREVLGLRVSWEKRYITLGPVATLLGLAFKAYDPDHLLGEQEELGITCALVPTGTPGVEIGRRHQPLNQAFMNGPNSGRDVFIPMDWVIGGEEMVGQGWRMLMESLSAGRGISLPSSSVAAGKIACRLSGAYARVRRQFGLPIGRFEGIEEPLARIAANTYMMDAVRRLTCAGLMLGEKPSVVSAIAKYHNTEGMRRVLNDAMDIHGGRGICMGPSNYLGRAYQSVPVAITVEGANILTRSLIIFGQGAMRCHPHLLAEIEAANEDDAKLALEKFDAALFEHLGYTTRNAARTLLYGLTAGRLAPTPAVRGEMSRYYGRVARLSAAFSFLADLTLLTLGGELKRREKLSGRFADALCYLFVASAVLKRYEDSQAPRADLPLVEWSVKYCLFQVQGALDEILRNFPSVAVGRALRLLVFPFGRRLRHPNDRLGSEVAELLLEPSEARDRLSDGIYLDESPDDVAGRLEVALHAVLAAEPIERRLRGSGVDRVPGEDETQWIARLRAEGLIDAAEADLLDAAARATRAAIDVDDFAAEELRPAYGAA